MKPLYLALSGGGAHAAAHAGVLPWSYNAHLRSSDRHGVMDMGVEQFNTFDPATGSTFPTDARIVAYVNQDSSLSSADSMRVRVAGIGYSNLSSFPDPPPFPIDSGYRLTIEIRDDLSGDTGTVTFEGTGRSNGFFTSGTGVVNLTISGEGTLFLGGNRYSVRGELDESETSQWIGHAGRAGNAERCDARAGHTRDCGRGNRKCLVVSTPNVWLAAGGRRPNAETLGR